MIWRTNLIAACLGLAVMQGGGCARATAVSKENDRLRGEAIELRDRIRTLELENAELRSQMQVATTKSADVSDEVLRNVPRVTHVSIGRLSHARDTDNNGVPDRLTVYLHPVDGRERFTHLVGTVRIVATLTPMDGEPVSLVQRTLSPTEVRDAYRSGITGTHYTLELPLAMPADHRPTENEKAFIQVEYVDGLSGETFTADGSVKLR